MVNKNSNKIKEKSSGEETFFFGNLKDIQIITMFAAFSAVILTLIIMVLIPDRIDRTLIIYTLIGTSFFLMIYLSVPGLYLNPRFTYWPDMIFVIALTLNMYALRSFSDFYFILFIVLLSVDAFALRFKHFILITILMIASVLFSNLYLAADFFSPNVIFIRTIIQLYSIAVTAVVMRFFAFRALSEKKEKEKIRRLAENTLSAVKNLRTLLDNIGDGIFAVDVEEKIHTSNTAAMKMLNWREAIINRKITEVIPLKDDDLKSVDPIKEVIKTGKSYQTSDLFIQKSKQEQMRLYLNIAPIVGDNNEPQGAIVIFRDITKEKEIEEERMEFVAVSSHELRTPLTVMEGYLFHVLNSEGKLKYDEDTKNYIEKAHKSALALQQLITDLLDVSRLDKHKMSFVFEKVDLTNIVDEVVGELNKKANSAGLSLVVGSRKKNIPKLLLDRNRIKEVIINLITNAIKFTEQGKIMINIFKEDQTVRLEVKDQGLGISEEDQKYIFNKFYRAENWRTKKTSGTGLGLYISSQIIESHGGKIGVESKLGKGSKFYFILPVSKIKKRVKKRSKSKQLKGVISQL
jgi:PAS domain S-box-containing protein